MITKKHYPVRFYFSYYSSKTDEVELTRENINKLDYEHIKEVAKNICFILTYPLYKHDQKYHLEKLQAIKQYAYEELATREIEKLIS